MCVIEKAWTYCNQINLYVTKKRCIGAIDNLSNLSPQLPAVPQANIIVCLYDYIYTVLWLYVKS